MSDLAPKEQLDANFEKTQRKINRFIDRLHKDLPTASVSFYCEPLFVNLTFSNSNNFGAFDRHVRKDYVVTLKMLLLESTHPTERHDVDTFKAICDRVSIMRLPSKLTNSPLVDLVVEHNVSDQIRAYMESSGGFKKNENVDPLKTKWIMLDKPPVPYTHFEFPPVANEIDYIY